ncbi:MAG: peptidylprolyl isomerase [Eubacteriales bacterium]|nr:peptidylprolyl isomerase [Eubacteriales bacterium]
MKYKFVKKLLFIINILIVSITASSCTGVEIPNPVIQVNEWSKGMVMILVAEEKNAFENSFGKDIWSLSGTEEGTTYEDYIIQNIKECVVKIMTTNLIFTSDQIAASADDKKKIEEVSKEYYNSLTEDDLSYIGCTEEDVQNLYNEYYKAYKTSEILIQGANDDISVSEAKVIEVEQIKLKTLEEANDIREKVGSKGVSFSYYAKQYSEDIVTTYQIQRGDEMSTLFPEVFYLNTGEISDVLSSQGYYYIFKCTNGYKEEETKRRREDLIKAIRQIAFDEQYDKFKENHLIYLKEQYWKEISISVENNCKANNFISLFDKYFGG